MTSVSNKPLSGLRILVTRPFDQTITLCSQLKNLGAEAVVAPCIEIQDPPDQTSLLSAIKKLDQAHWAIFFSPNAVIKSAPFIHAYWPKLPDSLKIAAIGKGTERALTEAKFDVDCCPSKEFNSEGLLACDQLQFVNQKKIILFQGKDGRSLVGNTLRARGATVEIAIAYQRVIPKTGLSSSMTQSLSAIIVTSCEGLMNLVKLLGQARLGMFQQLPLFVISKRMLTLANDLGFCQLYLAENASDDALITALLLWKEKQYDSSI